MKICTLVPIIFTQSLPSFLSVKLPKKKKKKKSLIILLSEDLIIVDALTCKFYCSLRWIRIYRIHRIRILQGNMSDPNNLTQHSTKTSSCKVFLFSESNIDHSKEKFWHKNNFLFCLVI